MAETLNLGTDGNWAVKKDYLLGYNSENGNFKPLPFDFTRASSATVVNKDGLIEIVGNGKPRIDFKDDSNGALLLEPTRTNLQTQSEYASGWIDLAGATLTNNEIISPNGTLNGSLIIATTSNSIHRGYPATVSGLVSLQPYTASIFMKQQGYDISYIRDAYSGRYVSFDLANGTVLTQSSAVGSIEAYGNGWYRCSATMDTVGTQFRMDTGILETSLQTPITSFIGEGTIGIYIYGAQLEAGSYATSYIPTQVAISTRVAEVCSQTPPSGIIGQTEGTIFFNADVSNTFGVQLGNSSGVGDFVNSIQIAFGSVSTNVNVFNGGAAQFSYSGVVNTGVKKVALTYKKNDFAFYIDGNQIITDNLGTIPSISGIFFNHQNLGTTKGLLTDLKIYNTRLSNSELQALTS